MAASFETFGRPARRSACHCDVVARYASWRELARYIDRYNRIRCHSVCERKSPIDYEAILAARADDVPETEAA